jgi:hypothetical protein
MSAQDDADANAKEVTQDSFASIFTSATQQTGTRNQESRGSTDSTLLFAQVVAQMFEFDRHDKRDAERARAQPVPSENKTLVETLPKHSAQRKQAFLRGFQMVQSSTSSTGSTASAIKAPYLSPLSVAKPRTSLCFWNRSRPSRTIRISPAALGM